MASSFFQGAVFGAANTALFVYGARQLSVGFGLSTALVPRLSLAFGCASWVLGMAFADSVSVRYNMQTGVRSGPIGMFLATWLALYILGMCALLVEEHLVMVVALFAVSYVFGRAKAAMGTRGRILSGVALLILAVAAITLLTPSAYVDEFATDLVSRLWREDDGAGELRSSVPPAYLLENGSAFAKPIPAAAFIMAGSGALMMSQ